MSLVFKTNSTLGYTPVIYLTKKTINQQKRGKKEEKKKSKKKPPTYHSVSLATHQYFGKRHAISTLFLYFIFHQFATSQL